MLQNMILIGFMGAGKTSIGKRVARLLQLELIDTDEWIEQQQNRSINDIFAAEGEPYFRDLETAALKELLQREGKAVISVGGGLPMREENRKLLHTLGTVIYLEADPETLYQRLQGSKNRPKLQGGDLREKIRNLMEQREETYLETAVLRFQTAGKTPDQCAQELADLDKW